MPWYYIGDIYLHHSVELALTSRHAMGLRQQLSCMHVTWELGE